MTGHCRMERGFKKKKKDRREPCRRTTPQTPVPFWFGTLRMQFREIERTSQLCPGNNRRLSDEIFGFFFVKPVFFP